MFYSHEILTSAQYGVATIWLVATVGSGVAGKRVTRRDIQQVDLKKACKKIIEPGAPIALRLQGNLLYGVSRVYHHQANYVLSDMEKMQSDMRTFARTIDMNTLDPAAPKLKSKNLTIQDDPAFNPMLAFSAFKFRNVNLDSLIKDSQASNKTWSQMSPITLTPTMSSGHRDSALEFDFGGSNEGSFHAPSPFLQMPGSAQKPHGADDPFAEALQPMYDLGISFNADGMEIQPGDYLQGMPSNQFDLMDIDNMGGVNAEGREKPAAPTAPAEAGQDIYMLPEDILPEVGALPAPQNQDENAQEPPNVAPQQRRRRGRPARPNELLDVAGIQLGGAEIENVWQSNYISNMEAQAATRLFKTTAGQARKNAEDFVFGAGIWGVGYDICPFGSEHPLVRAFAGDGLKSLLRLSSTDYEDAYLTPEKSRRRSAQEAFGSQDQERSIRPRLGQDEKNLGGTAGNQEQDEIVLLGDDLEVGRDAQTPLDDRRESSAMPWVRHSSVGPGSTIRSQPGSAQKPRSRVPSSPIRPGRGYSDDIERYSDSVGQGYGFSDNVDMPEHDLSLQQQGISHDATQGTATAAGMDTSSNEFLEYVTGQARDIGVSRQVDNDAERLWVKFEDMISPEVQPKAVAAQAFYHILSLATKKAMNVFQEGAVEKVPFGEIHVGVHVPKFSTRDDEDLDLYEHDL